MLSHPSWGRSPLPIKHSSERGCPGPTVSRERHGIEFRPSVPLCRPQVVRTGCLCLSWGETPLVGPALGHGSSVRKKPRLGVLCSSSVDRADSIRWTGLIPFPAHVASVVRHGVGSSSGAGPAPGCVPSSPEHFCPGRAISRWTLRIRAINQHHSSFKEDQAFVL